MKHIAYLLLAATTVLSGCQSSGKVAQSLHSLRVATFNVSMEATNYVSRKQLAQMDGSRLLQQRLAEGNNQQIRNIAEILQRVRPDIVLLNEFDYIDDRSQGVEAFIKNYLNKPQGGAQAIDYPYYFLAPVNTGVPTPFDLDNDGKARGIQADAQGFGFFPGQFAMVVLSKYPIETKDVRTFQHFLWSDMPGAMAPVDLKTGKPWYNEHEWAALRLSSKSHWDIPVMVDGKRLHVLASHPTPPVFDGPEDRNGKRNHDEIRLWTDYITPGKGDYIYDDKGNKGGFVGNEPFVIVGDQNASVVDSGAIVDGIGSLLNSPMVNNSFTPSSKGGPEVRPNNPHAANHTAHWGARADYVLPSKDVKILNGGIFWPIKGEPLFRLVKDREASSDHRLVWLDLAL